MQGKVTKNFFKGIGILVAHYKNMSMVEVLAVIRKEKSYDLRRNLIEKGIPYVCWNVKGRGKEGGLRYKGLFRDKILMPFLPKTAFAVWTEESNYKNVVDTFINVAHTGAYGDGKIFVLKNSGGYTMKLIKAVVRPEKAYDVAKALEKKGIKAMTMWDVFGRGREGGVQVGEVLYDELAKTMFMVAVEDEDAQKVVETITKTAYSGAYGDGKIFVLDVSEVWTIRTKSQGL